MWKPVIWKYSQSYKNTDNSSPVKAYATIVLNNNIAIHGFRIIDIGTDDNDAMFVAMPSNRNSDGNTMIWRFLHVRRSKRILSIPL